MVDISIPPDEKNCISVFFKQFFNAVFNLENLLYKFCVLACSGKIDREVDAGDISRWREDYRQETRRGALAAIDETVKVLFPKYHGSPFGFPQER